MATAERDYYEVLGIPRDADEGQIKKAFRRLARELHPDVNAEPDAQERFREVAEAYEVLSNPETRQLYDRFGHAGLKSGGYTPTQFDFGNLGDLFSAFFGDDIFGVTGRGGATRGGDIAADVEITLQEAARGTTRDVPYSVAVACTACRGSGVASGTAPETCPTCRGAGRMQQVSRSIFGEFIRSQTCPQCHGRGQVIPHPCEECDGSGRVLDERTLELTVPAGIHDGQRIRLGGEGHAGALGGRAGDVYVRVSVADDPRFVRQGNDVVSRVDLTMVQAAVGATVTVPTLDGEVSLDFEPGTQPGEIRVLRGKGMPVLQGFGRGEHRIVVNVAIPKRLTPEQRELLAEFERRSGEDTYKPDEGFFEKLKSAFR
jgi:molecular chaperone DnaJ